MIELLVVLTVATILLGLLMPTLSRMRESARQIGCASNQHQLGLGLHQFTLDSGDLLPRSVLTQQDMNTARTPGLLGDWDGLGWLYRLRHVQTPATFYCPSHRGKHPYRRYADRWQRRDAGLIFTNYHYRGMIDGEPIQQPKYQLHNLQSMPDPPLLITDGLRTKSDFNHVIGANGLEVDMSVTWVPDSQRVIVQELPEHPTGYWPTRVWRDLERRRRRHGEE